MAKRLSDRKRNTLDLIKGMLLWTVTSAYLFSVAFPEVATLLSLFVGVAVTIAFTELLVYVLHYKSHEE